MDATQLRQNIYRLLDEILETGVPLEIKRKGKLMRIAPVEAPSKLSRLVRRDDVLMCDPEDIVEIDWSSEFTL